MGGARRRDGVEDLAIAGDKNRLARSDNSNTAEKDIKKAMWTVNDR